MDDVTFEFLFDRESWLGRISDLLSDQARANRDAVLEGPRFPYRFTRRETHAGSTGDSSGITVSSGANNQVFVVASNERPWRAVLVTEAAAQSERDAEEALHRVAVSVSGNALSLSGGDAIGGRRATGQLVMLVPARAEIVVRTSHSSVAVLDVAGAVRVASAHARSTILNTSGAVDVSAEVIDFAAASGHVNLRAVAGINLKITARSFDGLLVAIAGGALRLLVPREFSAPLRVTVPRKEALLCRTGFASEMRWTRDGDGHVSTWDADGTSVRGLHLRSTQSVVIDTSDVPFSI